MTKFMCLSNFSFTSTPVWKLPLCLKTSLDKTTRQAYFQRKKKDTIFFSQLYCISGCLGESAEIQARKRTGKRYLYRRESLVSWCEFIPGGDASISYAWRYDKLDLLIHSDTAENMQPEIRCLERDFKSKTEYAGIKFRERYPISTKMNPAHQIFISCSRSKFVKKSFLHF